MLVAARLLFRPRERSETGRCGQAGGLSVQRRMWEEVRLAGVKEGWCHWGVGRSRVQVNQRNVTWSSRKWCSSAMTEGVEGIHWFPIN